MPLHLPAWQPQHKHFHRYLPFLSYPAHSIPKALLQAISIYGNHVSNCHSITFSGTLTQFLHRWYSSYPCCPKAPCSGVGRRAAWGADAAGIAALPARTAFVLSELIPGIWGSAVAVLPARELGRASFAEVSKLSKQHLCWLVLALWGLGKCYTAGTRRALGTQTFVCCFCWSETSQYSTGFFRLK